MKPKNTLAYTTSIVGIFVSTILIIGSIIFYVFVNNQVNAYETKVDKTSSTIKSKVNSLNDKVQNADAPEEVKSLLDATNKAADTAQNTINKITSNPLYAAYGSNFSIVEENITKVEDSINALSTLLKTDGNNPIATGVKNQVDKITQKTNEQVDQTNKSFKQPAQKLAFWTLISMIIMLILLVGNLWANITLFRYARGKIVNSYESEPTTTIE